jgi:hypothetical protein
MPSSGRGRKVSFPPPVGGHGRDRNLPPDLDSVFPLLTVPRTGKPPTVRAAVRRAGPAGREETGVARGTCAVGSCTSSLRIIGMDPSGGTYRAGTRRMRLSDWLHPASASTLPDLGVQEAPCVSHPHASLSPPALSVGATAARATTRPRATSPHAQSAPRPAPGYTGTSITPSRALWSTRTAAAGVAGAPRPRAYPA